VALCTDTLQSPAMKADGRPVASPLTSGVDIIAHERTMPSCSRLAVRRFELDFPATRFFGSKRNLLRWLHDILSKESFATAFEPFGGTGSVSYLLGSMGKKVWYRDIFEWLSICARVLLEKRRLVLSQAMLTEFIASVRPRKGFIRNRFDGAYFVRDENEWLDGVCHSIARMTDPSQRDQIRYLLFQASLRKRPFNLFHRQNLALRTRTNTTRTFGNHATWDKSFPAHMSELLQELNQYKARHRSLATVLPAADAFSPAPRADLVYLDPPYLAIDRRTESYLERYHFLEGMIDVDSWPSRLHEMGAKLSLNDRSEINLWSSREIFPDLLFGAIAGFSDSIVVLSYPANSEPSRKLIETFFRDTFHSVSIYQRSRSIAMSPTRMTELVYVGRP